MTNSHTLTLFERKAMEAMMVSLPAGVLCFQVKDVEVSERELTQVGFICSLHLTITRPADVLVERIKRYTLVVKHERLPQDGMLILSIDQVGTPVELEAVSFDSSEWPHDADASTFTFYDDLGESELLPASR